MRAYVLITNRINVQDILALSHQVATLVNSIIFSSVLFPITVDILVRVKVVLILIVVFIFKIPLLIISIFDSVVITSIILNIPSSWEYVFEALFINVNSLEF